MKTDRRSFLLSSLSFSSAFLLSPSCFAGQGSSEIPPADLKQIGLDAFSDQELDLPYYVAHFHRIANSVVMEGKDRGFIAIPVWRRQGDNKPYNVRIMENILSLAFFYVVDRPWNPYRGLPALRSRLEASLEFWCNASNEGKFSEYSEKGYNLAATAFATKFMGETLSLLRSEDAPEIDAELIKRVAQTDRKTLETVFLDPSLRNTGTRFSNQYTNAFAGGLAYLDLYPDEKLRKLLVETVKERSEFLQSPAGFFYESHGPDWSYNLGTHHSNLRMCQFYAKGTELEKSFLEEERRFIDWFSYNAVYDKKSNGFWLNKEVETRRSLGFWRGYAAEKNMNQSLFLLDASPLSPAFLPTVEEVKRWERSTRAALAENWPRVPVLNEGTFEAYAPYRFLHRRHPAALPTDTQKTEAMGRLPYVKRDRFIEQRLDTRVKACFNFIRRPGYYMIFNSGEKSSKQQCLGIGLIWTPEDGVVLQSQREAGQTWGTLPEKGKVVVEANDFFPKFSSGNQSFEPEVGIRELPDEPFSLQYAAKPGLVKILSFQDRRIDVKIVCSGPFSEILPLFPESVKSCSLEGDTALGFQGDKGLTRIEFPKAVGAKLRREKLEVGGKRLHVLEIAAKDELEYSFVFGKSFT